MPLLVNLHCVLILLSVIQHQYLERCNTRNNCHPCGSHHCLSGSVLNICLIRSPCFFPFEFNFHVSFVSNTNQFHGPVSFPPSRSNHYWIRSLSSFKFDFTFHVQSLVSKSTIVYFILVRLRALLSCRDRSKVFRKYSKVCWNSPTLRTILC